MINYQSIEFNKITHFFLNYVGISIVFFYSGVTIYVGMNSLTFFSYRDSSSTVGKSA